MHAGHQRLGHFPEKQLVLSLRHIITASRSKQAAAATIVAWHAKVPTPLLYWRLYDVVRRQAH